MNRWEETNTIKDTMGCGLNVFCTITAGASSKGLYCGGHGTDAADNGNSSNEEDYGTAVR